MGNKERLIDNALDIWNIIQTTGGLDEKNYDEDFVNDLKVALGGTAKQSVESIIKERVISNEEFLSVFFSAVQPFSGMLNDLLIMFERAGADSSNDNINIQFDFQTKEKFQFDVNSFKKMKSQWREIESKIICFDFKGSKLWEMIDPLRGKSGGYKYIKNVEAREWISEYENNQWPKTIINCPKTGYSDLDNSISQMWVIWSVYISECKKIIPNVREIKEVIKNDNYRKDFFITTNQIIGLVFL